MTQVVNCDSEEGTLQSPLIIEDSGSVGLVLIWLCTVDLFEIGKYVMCSVECAKFLPTVVFGSASPPVT